jgi:hypothetical protein
MEYDDVITEVSKQTKIDEGQVKETIDKFFEILSKVKLEQHLKLVLDKLKD